MSDRQTPASPTEPRPRPSGTRTAVVVAAVGLVLTVIALLWPGVKPVWLMLTEAVIAAAFAAVLLAVFNSRSLDRR